MADRSLEFRRWSQLMDRVAVGEPLSPEEHAFCQRFAAAHPRAARETELLGELANLDGPPDLQARRLVDGALARLSELGGVGGDEPQRALEGDRGQRPRQHNSKRRPLAPHPRFKPWLAPAIGLSAAAAIALFALVFTGDDQRPAEPRDARTGTSSRVELVYVSGDVRVDGEDIAGRLTMLSEGSTINAGRGSACVAIDPDIDVCLAAHSQLRLSRIEARTRRLDLDRGKVAVKLAPQPEDSRLAIVADGVWSTAVGTAFTVERSADSQVSTTVLTGKVKVGRDGANERMVFPHQRARLQGTARARATRGEREQAPQIVAVSRREESPEWALLHPAKLWSDPLSTTLELEGLPVGAEIVLDGETLGRAPLSSLIPAGSHRLEVRIDGVVRVRRDLVSRAGRPMRVQLAHAFRAAPQGDEEPAAVPRRAPARAAGRAALDRRSRATRASPRERSGELEAAAPARPDSALMLAEARRLMRQGDFSGAAERYEALRETHPDTREAKTVMVSLAQLELERLGRPRAALARLEQYLADGGGSLAQEARRARIRALRKLGDRAAERKAIADYLVRHPESFEAAKLRRRLGELGDGDEAPR